MKNARSLPKALLVSFLCLFGGTYTYGYNLKQYSTKEGLSDNVVSAIYQDRNGLMWFGTDEGIDTFDGLSIHHLKLRNNHDPFAGSMIGHIFEAEDNIFWILTNQGLYRFDRIRQEIKQFNEFNLDSKVAISQSNQVYAIKADNNIEYYNPADSLFQSVPVKGISLANIMEMFVDKENILWIFTDDNNHRSFSIDQSEEGINFKSLNYFKHPEALLWCYFGESEVYFVDATLTFYEYDLTKRTKYYIQDIRNEVLKFGDITSIIRHADDYFVSFGSGKLLRIKNMPDQRTKFKIEEIDLPARILCLTKDRFQDVVWAGTDGKGVSVYYNDESSTLDAVLSNTLNLAIKTPLTAFFLDDKRNLWLGTAGDGIVNMKGFDPEQKKYAAIELLNTQNSLISSPAVYGFSPSKKNIFWIATDNGVSYYSYSEQRIKALPIVADNKPVKYIRSICELNDTTLWIATYGEGVVKARLSGNQDTPLITNVKRILIGDGDVESNRFTVTFKEDDATVWLGTEGIGVYKVNNNTDKMENIQFGTVGNKGLNNIHTIYKNKDGYWFGTAFGLVRLNNGARTIYNDSNGFPFRVVNGILEDNTAGMWLSTNGGIVKFFADKHSAYLCKQSDNKLITDFQSRAALKDNDSGILMFGGSNGFVTINLHEFVEVDYTPGINITGITIFGEECNLFDYLKIKKNNRQTIRLNYDQNVFAISFVAYDYIDGSNYTYFYKLDEQGDSWINNSDSNIALFTYLTPGTYTLSMKYRNVITGKESPVNSVTIRIVPVWYRSWWATLLYVLLAALIVIAARKLIIWYTKKQKNKLVDSIKTQHLKEVYQAKLQFFSDIANELYNPLTYILNPSRMILTQPKLDRDIKTYATVIHQNAERMREFIHDIIEYHQIENGEKQLEIRSLPVSELSDNIAESFIDHAEQYKIDYRLSIDSGIYWNSDYYCFRSIIRFLLLNVFTNTSEMGTVSFKLSLANGKLQAEIGSNGVRVDRQQLAELFDNFKIIDIVELHSRKGLSINKELTWVLCHSMIKLLNGELEIKEDKEGLTVFTIGLPQLKVTSDDDYTEEQLPEFIPQSINAPRISPVPKNLIKKSILIITDDNFLLWLFTDQFADKYNVDALTDPDKAIGALDAGEYGLIVTEINVGQENGGLELVKVIKNHPKWAHLPCALMASENTQQEKINALKAGADIYAAKPFNFNLMEKEVDRLLEYKELQDHYTSLLSRTFDLDEACFTSEEDKIFYWKMLEVIEKNMTDPDLSVEMLSAELGCGTHQLYRRLKKITEKTPNEIIREYRFNTVELLLVSTHLSVDEILLKAGFISRSNFFKLFSQKHGMTPRQYREQQKRKILKNIRDKRGT